MQTYGIVAIPQPAGALKKVAPLQAATQDRRAIGQTVPQRITLKSKRSNKFSANPIDVSVFDGAMPIALSKTKPLETTANEDVRKFKTNLAIDYPKQNPALETSMSSTKPLARTPLKVEESMDNLKKIKNSGEKAPSNKDEPANSGAPPIGSIPAATPKEEEDEGDAYSDDDFEESLAKNEISKGNTAN